MSNNNIEGQLLLPNLLLLGGVIVAMLVIVEISLRVIGIANPSFYVRNDVFMGYALRPHAQGWHKNTEGQQYIRINSRGLRDWEHSLKKPEGTVRIAMIGDSFTEAFQVSLEDAYWNVMREKLLEECSSADQNIEMINFGVGGYGTAQQLQMLKSRALEYDPDIVLLAVFTGNDLRNNVRELENDPLRPYFVEENGELVFDASFRDTDEFRTENTWYKRMWDAVYNRSRALQVTRKAWQFAEGFLHARMQGKPISLIKEKELPEEKPEWPEQGVGSWIYKNPTEPVYEQAWSVTEKLILAIKEEVKNHGARFGTITISPGIGTHPSPKVRERFEQDIGVPDLLYPDNRIVSLGQRDGFPVLSLTLPLRDYSETNNVFLYGTTESGLGKGHWNKEGHGVAGVLSAEFVCENLL